MLRKQLINSPNQSEQSMEMQLTEDNIPLYAAKHYYNPLGSDHEEFIEDLKRLKYIKRLVNRYIETDYLADRLILNHLIVIHNVFGVTPGVNMLKIKLTDSQMSVIKPFLVFLRYIKNDEITNTPMDPQVVERLRNI